MLSEVDNSYKIFFISNDGKQTIINDFSRLDGFDINYILEEFMGTKSRNKQTEELVRSVYAAINEKNKEKAVKNIARLKRLQMRITRML